MLSLMGIFGWRTQFASLGRPARFPCPGTSLPWRLSTHFGQPCGAERATAGFGNLADDLGTEACGNRFDVLSHVGYLLFLPLGGRDLAVGSSGKPISR